MGVIVKGKQTTYGVTVEIDEDEIFKALWEVAGLSVVYSAVDCRDYYWERKPDKLVEMEDINQHGEPCWLPTGREITDPIKIQLYEEITKLTQLLKEQKKQEET